MSLLQNSLMDNSDVLSDCSESSKISECFSSNLSTLSGLSEYQGEFFKLKQLIDPLCSTNGIKSSTSSTKSLIPWYENQIKNLNVELQNALKECEKYKNDLYNLEKKKDILNNQKIEELLKQNNQLETNLLVANNQIQRLLNIYNTKDNHSQLEDKIFRLEKTNQELSNQNYQLSNELRQCNYHKSELESDHLIVKAEISDLKLDLAAKLHCVDELKKKILDQHVELQNLSQNGVKLIHELDLVTSELDYVRKSENWYKNELHQLQREKNDLTATLLQNEKIAALQKQSIEEMKLELSNWKCTYDELRLATLKEKERILKQFETPDSDAVTHKVQSVNSSEIERLSSYYETIINDLTNDVIKIKSDFEHQQSLFENVSKENSEVLTKYFSLQNRLKEKESKIEQLESIKKELKTKLSLGMDKQMEQSSKLLDLNKTCIRLENELHLKNQEKELVENSVKSIKEQFNLLKNSYHFLNEQLCKKNKELMQLQCDKEELQLNSNQNISDLKKNVEKSAEDVRNLTEKLAHLEDKNKELEQIKAELEERNKIEENNNKEHLNGHLHISNLHKVHIIDLLEYLCKTCNIGEDGDYVDYNHHLNPISSGNQSDYINLLLNRIALRFQSIVTEIASKDNNITQLKRKLAKLRKDVINRVERLENKCKMFVEKNDENANMLKMLCESSKNCDHKEEYKHLQALLQVKIQEEKDKQKRYERNYRTLLRKVREHMKGRNIAEKHNLFLQELHNNLSEECNSLKLQLELKDSEINNMQSCMDNYLNANEKLKQTTQRLEAELAKPCSKCVEFKNLTEQNEELKELLNSCEKCNMKEDIIAALQNENQRLSAEVLTVNTSYRKMETLLQDKKDLDAKVAYFEKLLLEEKELNQTIKNELCSKENNYSRLNSEKEQLNKRLQNVTEKNTYLTSEIEHINSRLQQKSEEVNELQLQKKHSENKWLEKEANMQKLIIGLKNQIMVFKNEVDSIKNDRFFLQRLCSDLKVALRQQVDCNKALKEYFNNSFKEKEKYDSTTILSNFPSPTKYDDSYINRLLEENRTPLQDTPLSDIQDSLNTLRNEIFVLQKQISEKNYL